MKRILIVPVVVALMALTVTTALANHGARVPTAPMPAHGTVWFGAGMVHQESLDARLMPPVHGSIWFGEGLERYHTVDATAELAAAGSVWSSIGH